MRLRDANALVIASLVNGANKDLSLTAGTTITGLAGNIDTGSADLAITVGRRLHDLRHAARHERHPGRRNAAACRSATTSPRSAT